jgi:hypothetical protein
VINLAGEVKRVTWGINFKQFLKILIVALVLNDETTEI